MGMLLFSPVERRPAVVDLALGLHFAPTVDCARHGPTVHSSLSLGPALKGKGSFRLLTALLARIVIGPPTAGMPTAFNVLAPFAPTIVAITAIFFILSAAARVIVFIPAPVVTTPFLSTAGTTVTVVAGGPARV